MKNTELNMENTVINLIDELHESLALIEVYPDVVVHFPYRAYVYHWYHHMMPTEERQKITQALKDKDYYAFIVLYKKYAIKAIEDGQYYEELKSWLPMVYLPDTISVYDENTKLIETVSVLKRDNFDKITETECECG